MSDPELPPNYQELDLLTQLSMCTVCGATVARNGTLLHNAWHHRTQAHEKAVAVVAARLPGRRF